MPQGLGVGREIGGCGQALLANHRLHGVVITPVLQMWKGTLMLGDRPETTASICVRAGLGDRHLTCRLGLANRILNLSGTVSIFH